MAKSIFRRLSLAGVLAAGLATMPAYGDFIINTSGTTSGPVTGQADFHVVSNTVLDITLTNTSAVAAIAQLLEGLNFTLTGSTLHGTILSVNPTADGSGNHFMDCTGKSHGDACTPVNTFVDHHPPSPTTVLAPYGWTDSSTSLLAGGGSWKPAAIINGTSLIDEDGLGDAAHNDYLMGPVTFVLQGANLLSLTNVSNVTFQWGTQSGDTTTGTLCTDCKGDSSPVPETSSVLLLGTVSGLLVPLFRRFRKS